MVPLLGRILVKKVGEKLKNNKSRKTSSTQWLKRRVNDQYIAKAKTEGYRSRAAFKLLEIEEKYGFIKKAKNCIIDLGSAPGSWLQVICYLASPSVTVIGLDIQNLAPVGQSYIIQGDFTEPAILLKLKEITAGKRLDLILSDMAPPTCGDRQTDHLRIIALVEAALSFIENILEPGGNFIAKIWHGAEEYDLRQKMKAIFHKVILFKPKASYSDSSEMFLIGLSKF